MCVTSRSPSQAQGNLWTCCNVEAHLHAAGTLCRSVLLGCIAHHAMLADLCTPAALLEQVLQARSCCLLTPGHSPCLQGSRC